MENTKIKKPLMPETRKQYASFATWCNENGYAVKETEAYYYAEKFIKPKPSQKEQNLASGEAEV
ncbi:MAG: hypothetical protein FWC85_01075 [Elusimicrobia bacterium]|nr:hypothetical protein [Elusimicrobiota bacterium]